MSKAGNYGLIILTHLSFLILIIPCQYLSHLVSYLNHSKGSKGNFLGARPINGGHNSDLKPIIPYKGPMWWFEDY